jgi:hypothetical protein
MTTHTNSLDYEHVGNKYGDFLVQVDRINIINTESIKCMEHINQAIQTSTELYKKTANVLISKGLFVTIYFNF